MADIKEHPNVALRKEVEELKLRLRLLEEQNDQHTRVNLMILEKYEALRDLVLRALKVVAQNDPNKTE
jgi:hypothetical protein